MPKVFIAADHSGVALKEALLLYLRDECGYDAEDRGAFGVDPEDDYPEIVVPCAQEVVRTPNALGIIIGGSGQGEAMAVNRIAGVRAAVFYGTAQAVGAIESEGSAGAPDGLDIVRLARRHNNANILSIGARFVTEDSAKTATKLFIDTEFSGEERHARRIAKY